MHVDTCIHIYVCKEVSPGHSETCRLVLSHSPATANTVISSAGSFMTLCIKETQTGGNKLGVSSGQIES